MKFRHLLPVNSPQNPWKCQIFLLLFIPLQEQDQDPSKCLRSEQRSFDPSLHLSSFTFTVLIFLCVEEPRVGDLGLLITPSPQYVCYIHKMPWTEGLHSASWYWGQIPALTIILMKQIIIIMAITYTEQQQRHNERIKDVSSDGWMQQESISIKQECDVIKWD